jgi:hypothetical protein
MIFDPGFPNYSFQRYDDLDEVYQTLALMVREAV